MTMIFDGRTRNAGRNPAHDRNRYCSSLLAITYERGLRSFLECWTLLALAFDHRRQETAALALGIAHCHPCPLRQFRNFQSTRAMRQPADEAALLQRHDKPVNARL